MRYSVATLPQQIPANTGHWPNAATEMTHNLQRWPSICLALDHCLVFFWNDSGVRFYILYTSQWARSTRVALAQCLSNVDDVGPALYKCCTGVLYLLGLQQQYMRSR